MNFKILAFFDTLLGNCSLLLLALFSPGKRKLPEKFGIVAVLKFLGNGSLILAAPALYGLKKRYPQAKMILYTTKSLQPHAGMLKLFDEIILLTPSRPWHSFRTLCQLRRRLISGKGLIINLEFLSRMAIFITGFLRGAFAITLSRKNYRGPDRCIIPEAQVTMAEAYDMLVEKLGAAADCTALATSLRSSVDTPLKRVIIAPFCSSLSLRRMWPPEKWSALIGAVRSALPEYSIALIGAPADHPAAEQIIENSNVTENICNYCGKLSFAEAFSLIRQSSCFCGIDSAPLHLARLAAVPSVSLWGATDPVQLTRNFPGYPEIIIFAHQECSPCVHTRKKCRLAGGCLNTIPTPMVTRAIQTLLDGGITGRKIINPESER